MLEFLDFPGLASEFPDDMPLFSHLEVGQFIVSMQRLRSNNMPVPLALRVIPEVMRMLSAISHVGCPTIRANAAPVCSRAYWM